MTEPLEGLAELTRYAWEFRYPGESSEPSREEAQRWLSRSREVFAAVVSRLPEDTRP